MQQKKDRSIIEINIVFFITALLLLTVGVIVQSKNVKVGLIITEFILVLLPPIIYLKIKGVSLVHSLRLNKLRIKHGLLIMGITTLCYPVALFVNLIILTLLSTFGPIQQPPIPVASNFSEYIILMFIIAVSAGICEEVFFRGMLLRGYEKLGIYPSIILSSVLFGMFHFNIQNLAGPVFLGILFGYLVIKTDSLFAGIIGHITNNGVAVTIGYLANAASERALEENIAIGQQIPGTIQLLAATVSMGVIAVLTGLCALILIRIILKDIKVNTLEEEYRSIEKENYRFSALDFIPVFLTVAIFIILGYLQINHMVS